VTPKSRVELERQLLEHDFYHSIDAGDGVTTKGWWDLRHALNLIPFPDVKGMRCLDIGTWDGFYAFEMERRGAGEVVALDVPDLTAIDYPPAVRAQMGAADEATSGASRNAGFHILREMLGSSVVFRPGNVYDLSPNEVGTFDVVVMGSLLLHLRDPVLALNAVRSVVKPDGHLLSVDYIHPAAHVRSWGKPIFELRGEGVDFQWWLSGDAGYRHLLSVGGFDIERASPFFLLRPGAAGSKTQHDERGFASRLLQSALARDRTRGGHLHRAYLTRRRL
jgi:tRNA (mo5U34)-methyltransferase